MKQTVTLIIFLLGHTLYSQELVQVSKKTYARSVPAKNFNQLFINAEKADMEIDTWNQNTIKYEVVIKTKHPKKEQVIKDQEKIKFVESSVGKEFFLRTVLSIKKNEQKPQSNFEISYKVTYPKRMKINVQNTFAEVHISKTQEEVKGNFKFCKTTIQDGRGSLNLTTKYGTLEIENCSNSILIAATHTKMELTSIKGDLEINAEYGSLSLVPNSKLSKLKLKAQKTEVALYMLSTANYYYRIKGENTKVELPAYFLLKNQKASVKSYTAGETSSNQVDVDMYFGTFKLENIK